MLGDDDSDEIVREADAGLIETCVQALGGPLTKEQRDDLLSLKDTAASLPAEEKLFLCAQFCYGVKPGTPIPRGVLHTIYALVGEPAKRHGNETTKDATTREFSTALALLETARRVVVTQRRDVHLVSLPEYTPPTTNRQRGPQVKLKLGDIFQERSPLLEVQTVAERLMKKGIKKRTVYRWLEKCRDDEHPDMVSKLRFVERMQIMKRLCM